MIGCDDYVGRLFQTGLGQFTLKFYRHQRLSSYYLLNKILDESVELLKFLIDLGRIGPEHVTSVIGLLNVQQTQVDIVLLEPIDHIVNPIGPWL